MASRYTGMSNRRQPAPLLRMINGKERNIPEREVAVDDPPLSSGDEDEVPTHELENRHRANGLTPGADDLSSDESESESRTRGAIKRTNFGTGSDKSKRNGIKRPSYSEARDSVAEEFNEPSDKAKKRRKLNGGQKSRSTKSTQDQPTPTSSGYLKDEQGFIKRRTKTVTYGSQKTASSQGSQKQKAKGDGSNKVARVLAPDPLSSPHKSRKANILAPRGSISPTKEPPARIRRRSKDENSGAGDLLDSPEPKTTFKQLASLSQTSQRSRGSQGSESKSGRKKKGNIWGQSIPKTTKPRPKSPPRSPRARFMMPADLSDVEKEIDQGEDAADLPSDFEFLSDSTADEGMPVAVEDEEQDKTMTSCPWCDLPVESRMLKDFSKGKRMGVKLQERFCHKHRTETALDTWRTRHYPTIQWADLEDRFAEHQEFLLGIINGDQSHFRDLIARDIGSGKAARSVRKEGNLTPGYYGPRGFDAMSNYIQEEFEDSLREKAVSDRVISGRGPMAFVQTVLVAELAVRLIQEDMDVSAKEAREIMEESKALGELLHE